MMMFTLLILPCPKLLRPMPMPMFTSESIVTTKCSKSEPIFPTFSTFH